eukprot:TRINITY_DN19521_c0_g1_i1.p1 TRINITY_DN19521_c0_g1~~TRINITY_DN19521_c0_g1_i1.p1  ORF type:complete len:286 (+),score=51.84 TRINITY_DN19521_c0_g1_i1:39-896(+)
MCIRDRYKGGVLGNIFQPSNSAKKIGHTLGHYTMKAKLSLPQTSKLAKSDDSSLVYEATRSKRTAGGYEGCSIEELRNMCKIKDKEIQKLIEEKRELEKRLLSAKNVIKDTDEEKKELRLQGNSVSKTEQCMRTLDYHSSYSNKPSVRGQFPQGIRSMDTHKETKKGYQKLTSALKLNTGTICLADPGVVRPNTTPHKLVDESLNKTGPRTINNLKYYAKKKEKPGKDNGSTVYNQRGVHVQDLIKIAVNEEYRNSTEQIKKEEYSGLETFLLCQTMKPAQSAKK